MRLRRRMTQDRLAKAVGVAKQTITRMETGSHAPQLDTIDKVAAALGVDPDELIVYHTPGLSESGSSRVPEEPGLTEENEAGLDAARRRKEELDEEILGEREADGTGDRAL